MHQFVFLGFQPIKQLSVFSMSFEMTSRALKDHALLVADAFSKKNQKQKNNTEMTRKSLYTALKQGTFPYCVTKEADNIRKNKENAQALAYFRLP